MTGTLHTFNNILDELNEAYQFEFYETEYPGKYERYDLQDDEYSDGLYTQNDIIDYYIYEYQNKRGYEAPSNNEYKFFSAIIDELNEERI